MMEHRGKGLTVAALALGVLYHGAVADQGQMRFRSECMASVCYLIGTGRIDPGAAERFQQAIQASDATWQILLDSPGGKLDAGMQLGRAIRAAGLGTVVAKWSDRSSILDGAGASCESACAFAFLGGKTRQVLDGARVGFHQFSVPGSDKLRGQLVLSSVQRLAGEMLSYIVEMDVDPRLFARAASTSGTSMYFPDPAQLDEYDVTTPQGFDHFILQPRGKGVFAQSTRLDATGFRDLVVRLEAFCIAGQGRLALLAERPNGISPDMDMLEAGIRVVSSDGRTAAQTFPIPAERIWFGSLNDADYIGFKLTNDEIAALGGVREIEPFLDSTGAAGGRYRATLRLNAMDRKMLDAAFRLCAE